VRLDHRLDERQAAAGSLARAASDRQIRHSAAAPTPSGVSADRLAIVLVTLETPSSASAHPSGARRRGLRKMMNVVFFTQ